MPNWCFNEIEITGNAESTDRILKLIVDENKKVDFNILAPMPKLIKGVVNADAEGFELYKENPARLGLLTAGELAVKLDQLVQHDLSQKNHKPTVVDNKDVQAAIDAVYHGKTQSNYALDGIKEALSGEMFTGVNTVKPVEQVIESFKNNDNTRLDEESLSGNTNASQKVLQILELDHGEYCLNKFGFRGWYSWAMANWGTKWNGDGGEVRRYECDGGTGISFSTAWSEPEEWFYTLCSKLDDIEEAEGGLGVSVKLTYAEGGDFFGGSIERDMQGSMHEEVMSDDEVREYLGLDEEEGDDEYYANEYANEDES